jgi:hypothetical protein
MPATSADITAATREAAIATWQSATIKARYPTLARDGSGGVIAGNCDAIADAQVLVDQQGALIGTEQRRFVVTIDDIVFLDPTLGVPCVTLIDDELAVNDVLLVTRIAIDLEAGTTSLELFG